MGFNSGFKGLMNGGIINSVTKLHLVGCFYGVISLETSVTKRNRHPSFGLDIEPAERERRDVARCVCFDAL